MQKYKNIARAVALLLAVAALFPSGAEASMFKLWLEGRGDVFSGSSDLFQEFDYPLGGGLELGIEVIEITLFGEAIMLGMDQFLFTLNLGGDFEFGEEDQTRFTIGLYTGPMFFLFPEPDMPRTVDLSGLSADEQRLLLCATFCTCGTLTPGGPIAPIVPCEQDIHAVEAQFSTFAEQETQLERLAAGWNLVRLRLAVDYPVVSFLYLGAAVQAGYHVVISGENVAAGARNQAVAAYAARYQLDQYPGLIQRLREAVGAEPVDTTALDGFNYGLHLYVRLELEP